MNAFFCYTMKWRMSKYIKMYKFDLWSIGDLSYISTLIKLQVQISI